MTLDSGRNDPHLDLRAISPFHEMGAYEALWRQPKASFKSMAEQFSRHPGSVPSSFVSWDEAQECATWVKRRFDESHVGRFGVQIHGAGEYPNRLRDAAHPVELLYYQGWWDLINSRCIAVIGTRRPSREGLARTRRLVHSLAEDDFTIVSGLAAGIDREAHETALGSSGRTIAVIGTPLSHAYPEENRELQRYIAEQFLIVSQVPLRRYESQNYRQNRLFFPARNVTMSALTEATVIVEAGETSGTLIQARAALAQGRKLFVLDNCFRNSRLTWPERLARKGAIRVRDFNDIRRHLSDHAHTN